MYTYFIISLFAIIVLYLVKSKLVEPLVSEPVTITESPSESEQNELDVQIENNKKTTDIYEKGNYLTENKINYDLVDSKIDTLLRQYKSIQYNYNNFQFQLHEAVTGTNPNSDITMNIGGRFPDSIQLSLYFPPPLPGITGQQGEPGNTGEVGKKGPQGKQGKEGPFGTCPK